MSGNLKQKLTRPSIWLRLLYMFVLAVAFNIAEIVIFAVVVYQFLATLFTRSPNTKLTQFGSNLARYIQQIICFMTFATEEMPFPFSSWPDEPHETPLVAKNDKSTSETKKEEDETGGDKGSAKASKSAPRKTSTPRKPRTPPKNTS